MHRLCKLKYLSSNYDFTTIKNGYENRSEYVRDLIRDRIARRQWSSGGEVIGTLTLIYNHHRRGLTEKLVDLQHHCHCHVLASTHVHLSHELCAEMIMMKGRGNEIEELANAMKRLKGVLKAELAAGAADESMS